MKRKLLPVILLGVLLLSAAPGLADDGFYVIAGRPAVGTRITSLPYTIKAPGYYYLGGNLSYAGGHAIIVDSDNVTIDLMGFTLSGPSNNNYYGISDNTKKNLEVRNGTISGWHMAVNTQGANHRVIGVRASGNTYGISLYGANGLIKGCTASQGSFSSEGWGLDIGSGTISGCTVMNFTPEVPFVALIFIANGGTASGNVVLNCAGIGIKGAGPTTISHNTVFNCTTGISGVGGGSVIGNAVLANSGQTGIVPSIITTTPNILDQNNVSGAGTHYGPGGDATVWGLNGGR